MSEATLAQLRERLESEGLSCIAVKGERTLTSTQRGIRPLLAWLEQGEDISGGIAADRIVGKAAALLYALMGVRAVYAQVLSESGLSVLREHGIQAEYGVLTERIINRAGTGLCPMEEAVLGISDPAAARTALEEQVRRLRAN